VNRPRLKLYSAATLASIGARRITHLRDIRNLANFGERQGEVRHSPAPMGEDFSGSCNVASRNPLIHNGATNTT
jgi:hypothetical protein